MQQYTVSLRHFKTRKKVYLSSYKDKTMFLNAFFSTGRIIFIIFFVLTFGALIVWSYRKDIKNHERYYKNAGIKVLIYGSIIIAIFVAIRILAGN